MAPTYPADVHGNADTTLDRSTNVVAVPGYTLGYVGVNAGGDQEAAEVLGANTIDASENREANDTNGVSISCHQIRFVLTPSNRNRSCRYHADHGDQQPSLRR